jgi:Aldo/keto reductase family
MNHRRDSSCKMQRFPEKARVNQTDRHDGRSTSRVRCAKTRGVPMTESSDFRRTRIPLNNGAGHMPALGFGTLIPDAAATLAATRDALEAGFRPFDCAERYRNEREVGEALQAGLAAGGIARADVFVTTKLWNTNHRPERVEPALRASLTSTTWFCTGFGLPLRVSPKPVHLYPTMLSRKMPIANGRNIP